MPSTSFYFTDQALTQHVTSYFTHNPGDDKGRKAALLLYHYGELHVGPFLNRETRSPLNVFPKMPSPQTLAHLQKALTHFEVGLGIAAVTVLAVGVVSAVREWRGLSRSTAKPPFVWEILRGGQLGATISHDEPVALADFTGKPLKVSATRYDAHKKELWHQVVHIYFIDPRGRLVLQRRSRNLAISPRKLQVSVSGHVDLKDIEKVDDLEDPSWIYAVAKREALEELGIALDRQKLKLLTTINGVRRESPRNNEFATLLFYPISDTELEQARVHYDLNEVEELVLLPLDDLPLAVKEYPQEFSGSIKHLIEDYPFIYQRLKRWAIASPSVNYEPGSVFGTQWWNALLLAPVVEEILRWLAFRYSSHMPLLWGLFLYTTLTVAYLLFHDYRYAAQVRTALSYATGSLQFIPTGRVMRKTMMAAGLASLLATLLAYVLPDPVAPEMMVLGHFLINFPLLLIRAYLNEQGKEHKAYAPASFFADPAQGPVPFNARDLEGLVAAYPKGVHLLYNHSTYTVLGAVTLTVEGTSQMGLLLLGPDGRKVRLFGESLRRIRISPIAPQGPDLHFQNTIEKALKDLDGVHARQEKSALDTLRREAMHDPRSYLALKRALSWPRSEEWKRDALSALLQMVQKLPTPSDVANQVKECLRSSLDLMTGDEHKRQTVVLQKMKTTMRHITQCWLILQNVMEPELRVLRTHPSPHIRQLIDDILEVLHSLNVYDKNKILFETGPKRSEAMTPTPVAHRGRKKRRSPVGFAA